MSGAQQFYGSTPADELMRLAEQRKAPSEVLRAIARWRDVQALEMYHASIRATPLTIGGKLLNGRTIKSVGPKYVTTIQQYGTLRRYDRTSGYSDDRREILHSLDVERIARDFPAKSTKGK